MTLLKWYGSKRKLADDIVQIVQASQGKQISYDLFTGSGSVGLAALRGGATDFVMNDLNEHLINFWMCVKNRQHVESLHACLNKISADYWEDPLKTYKKLVLLQNNQDRSYLSGFDPLVIRGSVFYALNKLAFSGLWRQNQSGEFNVNSAGYLRLRVPDLKILQDYQVLLDNATLLNVSYEKILTQVPEGEVVYIDPPYLPRTRYGEVLYGCPKLDYKLFRDMLTETPGVTKVVSHCNNPVFDNWMYEADPYVKKYSVDHRYCSSSTSARREPVKENIYILHGKK
jgi:DNA adenine methylase Dam